MRFGPVSRAGYYRHWEASAQNATFPLVMPLAMVMVGIAAQPPPRRMSPSSSPGGSMARGRVGVQAGPGSVERSSS